MADAFYKEWCTFHVSKVLVNGGRVALCLPNFMK